MSGHNKRSTIKHKKAKTDAKKSKVYAKIAKLITISARNGADASMNPALEQALQKAKYNSLPKEVIEKAIRKGSWQIDGANYEESIYEWYWPWGTAFLVKTLTDNRNRTNANLKIIFQKGWWNIAEIGAVARQFQEKWVIIVDWLSKKEIVKWNEVETVLSFDQDELEMDAIEMDAENIEFDESFCVITTWREDFLTILKEIEKKYHIKEADLQYISDNVLELDEETNEKVERLVDLLEDDDDVDNVWVNI